MILIAFGALAVGLSLGLCGSGGSILTVPVLRYLLHHSEKVAIAESLGIVFVIALVSALPYARARLVDWRAALLFGVPGMIGAAIGASGAKFVPGSAQLLAFAVIMLWAAALMWRAGAGITPADAPARPPRSAARLALEGLVVGAITGVVGVGGGFLIIPALVLLGRLDMRTAVGTSLAIIALQSGAGFWKHLGVLNALSLSVHWNVVTAFAAVGIVGSLIGRKLNTRIDPRALRRGFAVLLLVMGMFILGRETFTLLGPVA
ncbi:MAG: sulfite exporter TauE/SafE family protein [Phycisphaerae bacterium]